DDRVLPLRSASYNPATHAVKLVPRGPVALNQPLRLVASGSGALSDLAHNALDGNRDGIAGGNYIGPFGAKPKASTTPPTVSGFRTTRSNDTLGEIVVTFS